MLEELDWQHAVQDIPESGLSIERAATPEEREAVARALDLLGCRSLMARYALTPRGGGHIHLAGTVQAQVEQSCVVTLEPLLNKVAERFSVDYWPETELPEPEGGELGLDDQPDLEPIVAGRIEVGRAVFQALAGGIDLFPRKAGVEFDPPEVAEGDGSGPEGPFAALAKMKGRR